MEPEAQRLQLEVGKKHLWLLAGWHSQCLIAMQTSWFDLQPPEFQVASLERQLPPPLAQNNHKLGVCLDFESTQPYILKAKKSADSAFQSKKIYGKNA